MVGPVAVMLSETASVSVSVSALGSVLGHPSSVAARAASTRCGVRAPIEARRVSRGMVIETVRRNTVRWYQVERTQPLR
jgi:hypothetical protein